MHLLLAQKQVAAACHRTAPVAGVMPGCSIAWLMSYVLCFACLPGSPSATAFPHSFVGLPLQIRWAVPVETGGAAISKYKVQFCSKAEFDAAEAQSNAETVKRQHHHCCCLQSLAWLECLPLCRVYQPLLAYKAQARMVMKQCLHLWSWRPSMIIVCLFAAPLRAAKPIHA